MKYIIALDLDETLLNSKGEVSQFSQEVLKRFKENGCIIAISSTRGYGSCKKIAKIISADYVCCQSGNMIVDKVGNIVYKNGFSKQEIKDLIDLSKKFTKAIVVDSDTNLYGGLNDDFAKSWGVIHQDVDSLANLDVYKFCVYFEPEYRKIIEEYCKQHGYVCREMKSDPYLLITPANSDKFYALEHLIKLTNLDLEHLVVFGDDNSDSLSIKKAKYGVAMANAREEVKSNAKYVTKSNNEDGVAYFLERNL